MPRKHRDLIIAWANGAEIQDKREHGWVDCSAPVWDDDIEYRIKRKNIEVSGVIVLEKEFCRFRQARKDESNNIRLMFDWESGNLLSATVLTESSENI
jgi:hypothetical protein